MPDRLRNAVGADGIVVVITITTVVVLECVIIVVTAPRLAPAIENGCFRRVTEGTGSVRWSWTGARGRGVVARSPKPLCVSPSPTAGPRKSPAPRASSAPNPLLSRSYKRTVLLPEFIRLPTRFILCSPPSYCEYRLGSFFSYLYVCYSFFFSVCFFFMQYRLIANLSQTMFVFIFS